jgi:cytoskeletal protein CcmA (bactofilin family)
MRRGLLGIFALATFVVFAAFAAPAGAASDGSAGNDRRISVSGGVVVASGEVVNGPVVSVDGPVTINGTVTDDVYVGNGRLVIGGQVTGNVLVVHGDVLITGRVGSDVFALDGRITTRDGATVNGDVRSRKAPDVAPGTVSGHVRTLNIKHLFPGFLIVFLSFLWIAVTVSVALLGFLFVLLFPRAADATAAAGRRFWPTVGWGALIGIVGPILGVLVLFTIVGIPFGLGMLSALNVLAPLGYVASSLILGRLMVKGTSTGARIGAFFAGFGILRAAALIPGIGVIVWVLVCIYGLGALTQAAWRGGRGAPESRPVAPPAGEPPTLVENTVPAAAGAPASTESSAGEAPTTPAPGQPSRQNDSAAHP